MGTDARKIFVNPKKRIVKFEFVTFGPMRGERREVVHGVRGQRQRRGERGDGIGFQIGFALRWGKHKTDILSDVKLFRAFCLKLTGVVLRDLTHQSKRFNPKYLNV